MMLTGIDISHHNKNMKDPAAICKYDFVIMKASEGFSFRDNHMRQYMEVIKHTNKDMLIGFYHYARPEINRDPFVEARNFIETITPYLYYNPVLALDVEGSALDVSDLDNWCLEWSKYVYNILGVRPLIYCSASTTKRFKKCVTFGCGLWVAKWSDKIAKKDIKPWDFWAIWQNSNSLLLSGVRVDSDVFNGSREQFLKYGEAVANGKENDKASDNTADREAIQEG